jgi:hypothetical protein
VTSVDDGHVADPRPGAADIAPYVSPAIPDPRGPAPTYTAIEAVAPPAGRRNHALTVLAIVVVLLCVAAGGVFLALRLASSSSVASGPSGTPGPATTGVLATTSAPRSFEGDPRTLLLPIPPSATKTISPGASGDETMGLEQALVGFDNKAEGRKYLERMGYRHGAERSWLEPDRTWVGVILCQYGSESDASVVATGTQRGFEANNLFRPGVKIDGVPQGLVYQRDSISANGRWMSEAVFSKNDITIELFVTGPRKQGPEHTIALAQAQYALLP